MGVYLILGALPDRVRMPSPIAVMVKNPLNFVFSNLLLYGAAHALVDAICASVVTSLALFGGVGPERAFSFYLLYNFLAFAMQAPMGVLLDRARCPRAAARVGLVMQAAALAVPQSLPEAAIPLAGLGNALFHLGGGVIALNLTQGRATAPGIFVAPGAVGLFLGVRLGLLSPLAPAARLALASAALVLGALAAFLPLPANYSRSRESGKDERLSLSPSFFSAIGLIFFSIAVRSFIGLSLTFPWKNDGFIPAFFLAAAAGGGKALGGFLSDRLGFTRVSVGALLLSIPLFQLGGAYIIFGLAGCLCFQMTMAVTLLAYVRAYPNREAWAFGLACLALFAGSLPLLTPLPFPAVLNAPAARGAMTLASIVCLWRGLAVLLETPGRAAR
jgi:FSR family fosmidomycin resistance protein-like MFS transporter